MAIQRNRRVIIHLSGLSDHDQGIGFSSRISKSINADLFGLFVEEDKIFDAASLPFTRIVSSGREGITDFSPENLNISYRKKNSTMRTLLETYAEQAQMDWHYENESGDFFELLMKHSQHDDLLVVECSPIRCFLKEAIGHLRSLQQPLNVLLLPATISKLNEGALLVLDDGDEGGQKTLDMAAAIAKQHRNAIYVLSIADKEGQAFIHQRARTKLETVTDDLQIFDIESQNLTLIGYYASFIKPMLTISDMQGFPCWDDQLAAQLIKSAQAPLLLLAN